MSARSSRTSRSARRGTPSVATAYAGWVPFLCILAAIVLLATSAITWVTSPNWGAHNIISAPRSVGTVPQAHASSVSKTTPKLDLDPNRVDIPAIDVEAPIYPITTNAENELEPPLPPTRVGWWTGGARPGAATGTAVIAGHINYGGVAGALGEIGRLDPGNKVIVHGKRDGKQTALTFRVVAVQTYSKKTLPWQQIFNQQVAGRLALVTCGGPFDPHSGNYLDNIVVYAVLA